jgi:hypothetical protein
MALTANVGSSLEMKFGTIQAYELGVDAIIYRGALVVVRQTTGLAHAAIRDTADAYKQVFVGVALEAKTYVAAGDLVRVRLDGKLKCKWQGGTAYVGRLACLFDDETVQPYSTEESNVIVGRITEVLSSGTEVYVDLLDRPGRVATSANN